MQIYDSYLLKALDVKLPYSEDSGSWSLGHCDASKLLPCRMRNPSFFAAATRFAFGSPRVIAVRAQAVMGTLHCL